MSVRMKEEKLAQEAGRRKATASPAAAAAAARAAAAGQAERAVGELCSEAADGPAALQEQIDQMIAGMSQDIERVIGEGVAKARVKATQQVMLVDLEERVSTAVLPLFAEHDAAEWAEKVTAAVMPAVKSELEDALADVASHAIEDGLARVLENVQKREERAAIEREKSSAEKLDRIEKQIEKLRDAVVIIGKDSGAGGVDVLWTYAMAGYTRR